MSKLAHSMDWAVYLAPTGRYMVAPDFSDSDAWQRFKAKKIEGELLLTEAQDLASELGSET